MLKRRLPPGNRAPVRVLAGLHALDAPARRLGKIARTVIRPGPVKDALSGSWLGHPLHPVLTDVTIGTFTSALLLDWLGGRRSEPAAQRLIALGLLSTAPVVAAGYSDWADTEHINPSVRRIGVVHGSTNLVGASLFAASWAARRRGESGRRLGLAGGAALFAGGHLGGHLSFAEGVGVDQTTFDDRAEDWTAVLDDGDLHEGQTRCVVADTTPVMLARSGGELYALTNRCSHRGGPLHEGRLGEGTITCSWHDSVFDLRDGSLIHGPAAYPQPVWETRVRNGLIEVRRR
jgi:nitrite reductase/ring-hydroxylating ferredoxin subunit